MALLCFALLPSTLHASITHPHKLTTQHKAAQVQRIPQRPRARRRPRIMIAVPKLGNHAALDRATADRVHAFVAAQQHARGAQPVRAASVVTVARRTAPRPPIAPAPEFTATPVLLPTLYNKRGRLIVPPPLKGSHEILVHQNQVADRDGLTRIQNDADLERMRLERLLVALPISDGLQVDERLPANRRYCRPWTADFLTQLSREFYARYQTPLQVNSAVRTVEFQQHLMHINGNAAPAEGDTASPHLTGQAIDIAKHGLSMTQIAWLRGYLLPLVQEGKIDVEEEFQQACFHISVYKSFVPQVAIPRRDVATLHPTRTADLAIGVR